MPKPAAPKKAVAKKPIAAQAAAVTHAPAAKTAKPAVAAPAAKPAAPSAARPVPKAPPAKSAPAPEQSAPDAAPTKPVTKPAPVTSLPPQQPIKVSVPASPPAPAAARETPTPAAVVVVHAPEATAPAPVPPPVSPAPERRMGPMDRIPPRQPSKPENFAEGDHVVYPTHGVGKVERIATEEIAGHRLELIHITFEENRMTLRVPVAKARSAGLRKLASRKLFDEAMAVLKGKARIKRTMWSRRAQEYEAKINSGDPLAIAEVVRDLHRNAGQPDQSFSERQIYEQAMDRLAAELAALDKTDKVTAVTKLTDFLKTL
jgi:CarD family transcriptional regulator